MPSLTYVARRPGPFTVLVQAAEIGGLRLHPLPPIRVRDRFYDSDDAELLQEGLVLRVRDQDGARTAALRVLSGGQPRRLPDDVALPGDSRRLDLPYGPLAEVVRSAVRGDRLHPLLSLRQYRTPRVAFDNDRPVALLSFDVVVYEAPGAEVISNEVEIEPLGEANAADTERLEAAFREAGLDLVDEAKVERGIQRLPRSLSRPALVLPRERKVLESTLASESPLLRRRARVVLLDAQGFRPDTIAVQTGLSMARVRHWRLRFRDVRLAILDPDLAATPRRLPSRPTFPGPALSAETTASDAFAVPPAPRAVPAAAPADTTSSHTSASIDSTGAREPSGDMEALLEMFSPHETETPLLDHEALADAETEDREPDVEEWSSREAPAPHPVLGTGGVLRSAYPVVLGPFASTVPPAGVRHRTSLGSPQLDRPTSPAGDGAAVPTARLSVDASSPSRAQPSQPPHRPTLSGETPLLHAAHATIAYHVAAFERALGRLAVGRSDTDARRLLIACHRVRLSVESFQMVLPERASTRLLAALRPLAADLDDVLDLGRAAGSADSEKAVFADRRASALESALLRFDSDRQRAWGERARRLLARLDTQRAGGLLLGDDALPPLDDFVGQPGDLPMPSRLRHVAGSMLWARYQEIRVFEDTMETTVVESEVLYHLAIAVSSLHFVLGLAANTTEESVRGLAAFLNDVEHVLVQYWRRARTADLTADKGEGRGHTRLADGTDRVWEALNERAFRAKVASVVASI